MSFSRDPTTFQPGHLDIFKDFRNYTHGKVLGMHGNAFWVIWGRFGLRCIKTKYFPLLILQESCKKHQSDAISEHISFLKTGGKKCFSADLSQNRFPQSLIPIFNESQPAWPGNKWAPIFVVELVTINAQNGYPCADQRPKSPCDHRISSSDTPTWNKCLFCS